MADRRPLTLIDGRLKGMPTGDTVGIVDGGTGATTAAAARILLGLAIGTNVQAYSATLDQWAAQSPSLYARKADQNDWTGQQAFNAGLSGVLTGSVVGNASTATALATSRTINGTAFNGTANITTATWGTARNLTIGSTAKSVNGSAAVAWSLSEIGAAAIVHAHIIGDVTGLQAALDGKAESADVLKRVERGRNNDMGTDGTVPADFFSEVADQIALKVNSNTTGSTGFPTEFGSTVSFVMQRQSTRSFDLHVNTSSSTGLYYRGYGATGNTPGPWRTIAAIQNANTWTAQQTFNAAAALPDNQFLHLGTGGARLRGTDTGSLVLSTGTNATGILYVRPNGDTATASQTIFYPDGNVDMPRVRAGASVPNATGAVVLELVTERAWQFRQLGTAGNTKLELFDVTGAKDLVLTNASNANQIALNPTTSQVSASSFVGALTGNASTATTLQTARTINGTSFNGSTNLTTANWGTARTLTIGSTGKSVNGAANVAWTLAEIGAAAAGHTHALGDLSNVTLTSPTNGQGLVFNGTAWVNGTVGAGQFLPLAGGTISGALTVNSALAVRGTTYLGGGAGNTFDKLRVLNNGSALRVDAVNAADTAFTTMNFAAADYSFGGGGPAAFSSYVRATSYQAYGGAVGSQTGLVARGWSNGITRWLDVIEADSSLALYSYDTAGGTPTPVFNFKSPVAGGAAQVTFSGAVTSVGAYVSGGAVSTTGSGASFSFQDRSNSASKWDWYAMAGVARLWVQGAGDRVTVDGSGNVLASGNIEAGGVLANTGRARLNTSEAGRTGYLALFRSTGQRAGYIGYAGAGANRMNMQVEDGLIGWDVAGDMVHRGALYTDAGINMYWANASGYVRVPRIFVGGGDPGAAASDGDIWIT